MRTTRLALTAALPILALLLVGCPKRPVVLETPPPTPAAAASTARDFALNTALAPIHFDFDSDRLRPTEEAILDKSAAWLKNQPDQLLLIAGHADDRGTPEYNTALGERRAIAARAYLVSRGVEANRITTSTFGEQRPTCTERTDECRARNRRVSFLTKER